MALFNCFLEAYHIMTYNIKHMQVMMCRFAVPRVLYQLRSLSPGRMKLATASWAPIAVRSLS